MSTELPHASLQCEDCGTMFRVTLKKGRVPSKPVPCPKCKRSITVTEADIVEPGAKTAGVSTENGELRQTKPGDVLRETKLVKVDDVVAEMMDPLTSDVPVDPPTAEVDIDDIEIDESGEPPEPPQQAFGIIKRRGATPRRESRDDLGLTVGAPGVHVVKGEGRGRRDNVFGDRTASSVAIGRISTKRVQPAAIASASGLNIEDPDLPMPVSQARPVPKPASLPVEAPAESTPKAAPAKPKLDLSRLRKAIKKLDAEAEESEAQDVAEPVLDISMNPLDAIDLEDILSEASSALDSASSESADADADVEPAGESEPGEPELSEDAESEPEASEPPQSEPDDSSSDPDEVYGGGKIIVEDDFIGGGLVVNDLPAPQAEPDEPDEPDEPSAPSEPAETSDAASDEPDDSFGSTIEVASDAYELGENDAAVPDRPSEPARGSSGAVVFALVILVVIAVVAYVMLT